MELGEEFGGLKGDGSVEIRVDLEIAKALSWKSEVLEFLSLVMLLEEFFWFYLGCFHILEYKCEFIY